MDATMSAENLSLEEAATTDKPKNQKLLKILKKGLIGVKYGLELSDDVLKSGISIATTAILSPPVARVVANVAVTGLKIGVDKALDAVKRRLEK